MESGAVANDPVHGNDASETPDVTEAQQEYILGTDRVELERLRFQHQAWSEQLDRLLRAAGLREGDTVLDLGCGPGFTTCRLARFVGPRGRVIACDESAAFVGFLERAAAAASLTNVEARVGRVEDLDLAAASIDAAYGRWILSWLPQVDGVLARVAAALRPGGKLLLQEYLDWGAMKMLPANAAFDAAVDACMRSWAAGGGTIDISRELPALALRAGLTLESLEPVARTGRPGSAVWRWITEFFESYLPRLVERGTWSATERDACFGELRRLAAAGDAVLLAPLMADTVLRK